MASPAEFGQSSDVGQAGHLAWHPLKWRIVLSNEWSDYCIVIPPGSDMKDTVVYMEAIEADPGIMTNMLTTDEQGNFSMFIWYYKIEPGIRHVPAWVMRKKHNYDLIHLYYNYQLFVEMELMVEIMIQRNQVLWLGLSGHIQFKS